MVETPSVSHGYPVIAQPVSLSAQAANAMKQHAFVRSDRTLLREPGPALNRPEISRVIGPRISEAPSREGHRSWTTPGPCSTEIAVQKPVNAFFREETRSWTPLPVSSAAQLPTEMSFKKGLNPAVPHRNSQSFGSPFPSRFLREFSQSGRENVPQHAPCVGPVVGTALPAKVIPAGPMLPRRSGCIPVSSPRGLHVSPGPRRFPMPAPIASSSLSHVQHPNSSPVYVRQSSPPPVVRATDGSLTQGADLPWRPQFHPQRFRSGPIEYSRCCSPVRSGAMPPASPSREANATEGTLIGDSSTPVQVQVCQAASPPDAPVGPAARSASCNRLANLARSGLGAGVRSASCNRLASQARSGLSNEMTPLAILPSVSATPSVTLQATPVRSASWQPPKMQPQPLAFQFHAKASLARPPQVHQPSQPVPISIATPTSGGCSVRTMSWMPPTEPSWVIQLEAARLSKRQCSILDVTERSSEQNDMDSTSRLDQSEGYGGDQDAIQFPLRFVSASASRQHPAKRRTGLVNADAVDMHALHLGICDGVSGVSHLGIPLDALPRQLLKSCRAVLEGDCEAELDLSICSRRRLSAKGSPNRRRFEAPKNRETEDDSSWLVNVIQRAYDNTDELGATTLLLAVLRGSDLVAACLGDSALLILRRQSSARPPKMVPVFKTEPGRYDSRRPVQVQRLQGFSISHAHAVIQGAMVSTTPVEAGDLLVLGSDGLFDNLSDEDIAQSLEQSLSRFIEHSSLNFANLTAAASILVDFAISRVKEGDGKPGNACDTWDLHGNVPANNADDTTAIVAVVTDEPPNCEHELFSDAAGVLRDSTNVPLSMPPVSAACSPKISHGPSLATAFASAMLPGFPSMR